MRRSRRVTRARRLLTAVAAATIIWVSTMPAGYPQIAIPPHKMSGTGAGLGMEGLLACCKRKSAVIGDNEKVPVGRNLR